MSDGIKQGIGVLSAFKEALEETIQEAKEKGDLSTERAKDVLKDALEKAQSAAGDAKDRLDLVSQKEFDGLQGVVETIKDRVAALETHLGFGSGDDDGAEPETEEEDAPKAADGDDAGKNAAAGEDDSADHDQATEDASE
ncbi:MAG: hypothetical protein VX815_14660 [Gemmatimonadota bacterium]|nr:hypothetical protein [Gemmatimonadota bacterium]